MVSKDIIQNWGIPESIKDKNIEFIFNINDLSSDFKTNNLIEGLTCDDIGSKFCLYDIENNNIIFIFDFIVHGYRFFDKREKYIKLNCICVNDFEMRSKGIATYYLEKLIEFGIDNKIKKFSLVINPDDKIFNDINKLKTLKKEKLRNFYIDTFKNFDFNFEMMERNEDSNIEGLIFKK